MATFNDELSGIQAMDVIPEGCLSFMEAANYVIESTDWDFQDMLEECGVDSEDMLEEAVLNESLGDVKDKVVNTVQDLWAKIKAFFAKVVQWFKDRAQQAKDTFAKVKTEIQGKMDQKAAEKRQAFVDKVTDSKLVDALHKAKDADKIKLGKYRVYGIDKTVRFNALDSILNDSLGMEYEPAIKKFCDALVPGAESPSQIRSILVSNAKVGSETDLTGENITSSHVKEMADVVLNGKSDRTIKEHYNAFRNACKKAITNLKKENKKLSKDDRASSHDIYTKGRLYTGAINLAYSASSATMDLLRQRYNEYVAILRRVLAQGNRQIRKQKSSTNESADFSMMSMYL